MRFPLFTKINSEFWGGDRMDGGLYVYLTRHNIDHALTLPSSGFSLPILYPYGSALAYSDNYLLPSFVAKIYLLLTANFLLSYNLMLLTAIVLNGYVTFRTGLTLGISRLSSWWAGFAFMSLPFLTMHIMHGQLQWALFLPMAVLCSYEFCKTRSGRAAAGIGLSVVGAFLSSVYIALFAALLSLTILLSYALLEWRSIKSLDIARLIAWNSPSLALLAVLVRPYIAVSKAFGFRPMVELRRLSLSPLSYFSAPPENYLWGTLTSGLSHFEGHLFPGLLVLTLALLSLVSAVRRCGDAKPMAILSVVTLLFFGLSLGIHNSREDFAPLSFVYHNVLGFRAIRATGRFGLVADLAMILLAANYLNHLLRSSRFQLSIFTLAVVITAFEFRADHSNNFSGLTGLSPAAPEVYSMLAAQSEPGAVLSLPYTPTTTYNNDAFILNQTDYMHWALTSGHPMVNGYSGNIPKFHQRLVSQVEYFPDARSMRVLSRILGLQYIVYHPRKVIGFDERKFLERVEQFSDQLRLISKDQEGNFLFFFTAKVSTQTKEMLLPATACSGSTMALEVTAAPSLKRPIELSFSVDSPLAEKQQIAKLSVLPSSEPQPITLVVPPANTTVKPRKVYVKLATTSSDLTSHVLVRCNNCT